ncbi:PTS sugar transporter subunit IIA [Gemella sp. zg-570]|uniref:PTS sugar transporter subunit IIA n=1 Tax=Gemella sp. zg-570 TaxID=2840371 RepID=UPI001C0B03E3|nr:PTS sugar transporter subunit IIA [Gemella sp. zg-570]QWQ38315.1 PTS sugar transporter subunit IIA [Gemella sp. zg-570]
MIVDILKVNKTENIEGVYREVADYLHTNKILADKCVFFEELKHREELGSIKIYDDVYLPHILSENILKNIILRVDGYREKVLFILIGNADEEVRSKIFRIITKLLDRNFIEELFRYSKQEFEEKIKII